MGCPNIPLFHKDIEPDKLWKKLVHADNSNCTILAGTKNHAYSVIGVNELEYEGRKLKLV
jgi:hypothetical protein